MGRLGGAAGSAFGSVWVASGTGERAIRASEQYGRGLQSGECKVRTYLTAEVRSAKSRDWI